MLMQGKIRKPHGDNVEIMAFIQDYKVSVNISSASDGQVIQAKNVVKIGQILTERIVSLLFNDNLESTLPAYENKRLSSNGNPFFKYIYIYIWTSFAENISSI
jgi:hypothetical protein